MSETNETSSPQTATSQSYAKTAWIKVQLKSGAIEVHPGVISLDSQGDLVLQLAGSHITYKAGVWDSWSLTNNRAVAATEEFQVGGGL